MSSRSFASIRFFVSALPSLMAGCYAVESDQFVADHAVVPKPSERCVLAWLAEHASTLEEEKAAARDGRVRVGMTRRMVKNLTGAGYRELSRGKAILKIKDRPLVDKYDFWLYFSRGSFERSENDHLAAIIVRRSYVVWW